MTGTITVPLTDRECEVLSQLSRSMDLPQDRVMVQALRQYQAVFLQLESLQMSANSLKPPEREVNDPFVIKCHVQSCISLLRDEDSRTKTRELALAVTKLQEAVMWIDEHLRLS